MKDIRQFLGTIGLGLAILALGYLIGNTDKANRIYNGPRIITKYRDTCCSCQPLTPKD